LFVLLIINSFTKNIIKVNLNKVWQLLENHLRSGSITMTLQLFPLLKEPWL